MSQRALFDGSLTQEQALRSLQLSRELNSPEWYAGLYGKDWPNYNSLLYSNLKDYPYSSGYGYPYYGGSRYPYYGMNWPEGYLTKE